MIEKNPFPILERSSEMIAAIEPDRYGLHFPERCLFAFLGDEVEHFAQAQGCEVLEKYKTITKIHPIYKVVFDGEELVLLAAPLGAAAAGQLFDFLIGAGCKKMIAIGSCGSLVDLPENKWLLPVEALRDEGTSYHYLPAARTVKLQTDVVEQLEETFARRGLETARCMTWTTDAFYRETPELIDYRVAEGCQVVEMECSALAAIATFRGIDFGQILYTADSLANLEHDDRGWGENARKAALELGLAAVVEL